MFSESELAEARKDFERDFLTETIEVWRAVTQPDPDGDRRKLKSRVIAEIPGRIVRGSDPKQAVEAEQVVTLATWEVRLSLSTIVELQRERGCFHIGKSDVLRDKASGARYSVVGDDGGRSEEQYLSVTTVKVG